MPFGRGKDKDGALSELRKALAELEKRQTESAALHNLHAQLLNERAVLLQDLKQRNQELSAIVEVSRSIGSKLAIADLLEAAVRSTRAALDMKAATLRLVEGDKLVLKAQQGIPVELQEATRELKIGKCAAGIVAESGQSLLIEDIGSDPRLSSDNTSRLKSNGFLSIVVVPILAKGEMIGTLAVLSGAPRKIPESDLKLMEAIAGEIGVALENARLYEQALRRAEHLSIISELTRIITSSLNIEDVFDAFAQGLQRLVGFDRLTITRHLENKVEILAIFPQGSEPAEGSRFPLSYYDSSVVFAMHQKQAPLIRDLRKDPPFYFRETLLRQGLISVLSLPLVHRGITVGTLTLTSCQGLAYGEEAVKLVQPLAGHVVTAIVNHQLYAEISRDKEALASHVQAQAKSQEALENSVYNLARGLVKAWESRYPYKGGHSERVTSLCQILCREAKMSPEDWRNISLAALLHDIGMISMPDSLLLKQPPLEPADWVALHTHPDRGADLLASIDFPREVTDAVRFHQERYDGTGYPKGLKGQEIPLAARILTVADAYDAITSGAPFRSPKRSHEEAIQELRNNAGSQFDPELVAIFERVVSREP